MTNEKLSERVSNIQADVSGIKASLEGVQASEETQNKEIKWLSKQVNIAKGVGLLLTILAGIVVKAFTS
jgi:hypothetical protein